MADGPSRVPLHSLESMTNNFSQDRVLGSGAYGKVYLGKREDGQKIAVKIFHSMPEHGNGHFEKEFYNLANLQHQNIVQLVGFCHETRRELWPHNGTMVLAEVTKSALCFEFMENGSLNSNLFDESNGHDWRMRYTIIKGICNGLKYLHEELKPPIFHLDLKPSNILLDKNMIPKIADFGLSRFFNEEKSHITNSPIGTFGYLPPEFINQNIISNKLDIFSLGVVIIKIVAGPTGYSRSAEMTSEQFAEIVHGNWRNRLQAAAAGDLLELYSEQVKSCIKIALSCVEADRRRRPTIGDIVNMLTDTETLENYHGARGGATLGTNWASACPAQEKSGKEDRKTGPKNQVLSAVPVYGPANNRPVASPLHGALIDQVQEEKRMDRPVSSSTMTVKQVQNLFMAVEPLLPRVVRDGIQACIQRSSPEPPAGPPAWRLVFLCPPALPIFTGSKIEDVNGEPLQVILVDADTGLPCGALPQCMLVELVPLFGDFPPDGREDWTAGEFARGVVKERAGKRPLLTGEVGLTMRDGRAVVSELQFTDNSSFVRCGNLRIGARVVPGSYEGGRVAEAMTRAFKVYGHRGELYRKHYPPALGDDVWRLEKIGKEGVFHRELRQHGVNTVQEFLRMLMVRPDVVRAIMGDGMTDHMWEVTTSHAKTCDAGDKVYAHAGQHGATVYVNSICQLVKIEFAGVDCAVQQLSMAQKAYVHQLLVEALEQRENLQEAEPAARVLLHAATSSSSSSSKNSLPMLHNAAPVAPPPLPATPIVDEFSRCPGRTHGNPIELDVRQKRIKHDETMFGSG